MKNINRRILFILQLYPPVHGASTTGENIKKSNVINSVFECEFVRISTLPGKGSSLIKQLSNLIKLYVTVLCRLIQNRYDLVYITPCSSGFVGFYKDFGLCMMSKVFSEKVIYHFNDKGISTNRNLPLFIKKLFFANVKVILSSPLLYYDIEKQVGRDRVYYCAYGIPDDVKSNGKNEPKGLVTILFFAHMLKVKGVFDLLQACVILNNRGVDFVCNFVGSWYDIEEEEFLTFLRKNKIEGKIFFLGPQYGPDKERVLSGADIFSLPTFYPMECFPLGILEAMRWGLPVVTTNEGAIPEIIDDGKNGFIINKNDPEALADKLQYLISNEGVRREMGKAGRRKFEDKYTLEKFENRIVEIFKNALINPVFGQKGR